ncbi:hypothetical protein FB451DRAFT_1215823 [Mycena latifolia]|nr:hypothetical protein FB451DRAFT_1215823 [Mycena latifolia]
MDALRKVADDAQADARAKAHEIKSLEARHSRDLADVRAQMATLQSSLAEERETLQNERDTLKKDRELLAAQRSVFETARETVKQELLNKRKSVVEHLDSMIQLINSGATTTPPMASIPPSPSAPSRSGNPIASGSSLLQKQNDATQDFLGPRDVQIYVFQEANIEPVSAWVHVRDVRHFVFFATDIAAAVNATPSSDPQHPATPFRRYFPWGKWMTSAGVSGRTSIIESGSIIVYRERSLKDSECPGLQQVLNEVHSSKYCLFRTAPNLAVKSLKFCDNVGCETVAGSSNVPQHNPLLRSSQPLAASIRKRKVRESPVVLDSNSTLDPSSSSAPGVPRNVVTTSDSDPPQRKRRRTDSGPTPTGIRISDAYPPSDSGSASVPAAGSDRVLRPKIPLPSARSPIASTSSLERRPGGKDARLR